MVDDDLLHHLGTSRRGRRGWRRRREQAKRKSSFMLALSCTFLESARPAK